MKCLFAITPTIFLATSAAVASPDFARDVAPILERHCLDCHGPEKQSGGTRYDQREAAFGAGDSGGIAIVPGKPEESELIHRIHSTHKDERMPPKGERLSTAEIAHDP
jgi:mono/diheme cytochrome c family protein